MIHHSRFTISLVIITLFLDQLTKFLFFDPAVDSLNTGISFSFFSQHSAEQQILLIVLMLLFVGIILWQFGKRFPLCVGLIVGGAISNVLDRALFGGVRDFLPVPLLKVQNNLADWGIFIGLVGMVLIPLFLPFLRGEPACRRGRDLERSLRSPRDRERGDGSMVAGDRNKGIKDWE